MGKFICLHLKSSFSRDTQKDLNLVLISIDFYEYICMDLCKKRAKRQQKAYNIFKPSLYVIYRTLETVFHRLSKQLEFRQKYSVARRIFNSLLGVWISLLKHFLSCLTLYMK